MGSHTVFNPKKTINLFLILVFFTIGMILSSSCSQTVPEIIEGNATVIFDYETEESVPDARLGVFVETASDARRYESITVTALEKQYKWHAVDIIKYQNKKDKQFAGYGNFVVPKGEKIPEGEYEIIYANADGETVTFNHVLKYDNSYYAIKGSAAIEKIKKEGCVIKLCIYDQKNKILYFGDKTDNLADARKIWNKYKSAAFYRELWENKNGSVLLVMPLKKVTPENAE